MDSIPRPRATQKNQDHQGHYSSTNLFMGFDLQFE